MTSILKQDTPELPKTVPITLRPIVHHCLEKEPATRLQTAHDLAFALEAAVTTNAREARPLGGEPRSQQRWMWVGAASAALVAAAKRTPVQNGSWPVLNEFRPGHLTKATYRTSPTIAAKK